MRYSNLTTYPGSATYNHNGGIISQIKKTNRQEPDNGDIILMNQLSSNMSNCKTMIRMKTP